MVQFDDDDEDGASARGVVSRMHDADHDLKELIATAADAGVPIEDMIGGQTQTTKENFQRPAAADLRG